MSQIVAEDASHIVSMYGALLGKALGRTFLITGAGGMVGGYVIHVLMELARRNRDHKPRIIAEVRDAARAKSWLGQYADDDNFQFCECSVEDIGQQSLPTVDYIVHAASPASPAAFRQHPLSVVGANVLGTMGALEIARTHGARLCLISSSEVYGPRHPVTGPRPLAEHDFASDDPLDLRSVYPESKRMAENLCACHRAENGTNFVVARLGHTYGPGMQLGDTRVQTQFMHSALAGKGIVMRSDGKKTRAYTYAGDACAATLLVLLHGDAGRAYNIANDNAIVSIRQLAEIVLAQAGPGSGSLIVQVDNDSANMWSRMEAPLALDTSAVSALGWQPRIGVTEGIARTLHHYREQVLA